MRSLASVAPFAPSHVRKPDLTPVATVLTPPERSRVDAAGEGIYRSLHRDSVDEVIRDVRAARAAAIVLSVACCERLNADALGGMAHEFPRVPTLALLTELSPRTPQTLLALGSSGVRRLIDVRDASGWGQLRSALSDECGDSIQQLVLARLADDLPQATVDCWRFLRALFLSTPDVCTVRRLAARLGVMPSTLMSRFFRAQLPSPKRYLAMARLVRAAHLFENRGFSIANVANHLEYSSPQSFGRHVRTLLRVTPIDFRERYTGVSMLECFRRELVLPYREVFSALEPLTSRSRSVAHAKARARGGRSSGNQRNDFTGARDCMHHVSQ